MKPEELRIGNIVCVGKKEDGGDDIGTVDNIQSEKYRKWNGDENDYTFDKFGDANYWLCDGYYPVLLTPEWLERAGFETPTTSQVSRLPIMYERTNYPCALQFSADGISICRSGINAITAPIKYVHQLQNLYFALTGQELVFNPKH